MSTAMIELQPLHGGRSVAWSPAARPSRPIRPSREVYVRRRLAVVLVLATLLVIAGLSVRSWPGSSGGVPASAPGRAPAAAAAVAPPAASATYIVQPGDTLWSVGQHLVGDGDVARVVHQLAELNGDDVLVVGEELVLPS